jgi:hypothetical protein
MRIALEPSSATGNGSDVRVGTEKALVAFMYLNLMLAEGSSFSEIVRRQWMASLYDFTFGLELDDSLHLHPKRLFSEILMIDNGHAEPAKSGWCD